MQPYQGGPQAPMPVPAGHPGYQAAADQQAKFGRRSAPNSAEAGVSAAAPAPGGPPGAPNAALNRLAGLQQMRQMAVARPPGAPAPGAPAGEAGLGMWVPLC